MASIDRADWHYKSAEEEYIKEKNVIDCSALTNDDINEIYYRAANHIGLFINWLIDNDFIGDENKEDAEAVEAVKSGAMLGVVYFMEYCDGKFWECDVREDILPFFNEYFCDKEFISYYNDYGKWFDERYDGKSSIYTVVSNREDYLSFKPLMDNSYNKFINKQQ